jgi:hypothetical protein
MFGFFAPVFAAVGLWVVFGWMRARFTRADVRPRIAAVAPLVLIGLVLGMTVAPIGRIFVHSAYSARSLVGVDQRTAFAWLKAHVGPGDRVLNQFTDDSAWMEPLDSVTPLFAIDPQSVSPEDWGDRWYLLNHAGALATDRRDQAAVVRWHVRYVYVGSRVFTHQPRRLFARQLRASSAYREVWHQGSATIFEVASR